VTPEIVELKNVALVSSGNSAPQDQAFFEEGNFNFYRTSDVGKIHIGSISNSLDKLNQNGIQGLKLFNIGTILFPKSGASTFLNHRTILEKEGYVSSHLAAIKANNEFLLDKFLFYLLTTIDAKDLVQDASYPSLKLETIEKIKFRLPSLSIQQKIVIKLDAIFAEIEKAIAATEANIKNAEALYQSYLKDIFEHGKENWKAVKLNEIAEYFNGLTYSPKDVSDSGIIVLRSSNVQDDKLDFNDIVRVNLKVKDKIIVRDGDILMCSRNGSKRLVGKTATIMNLSESMTFGTFMMIVRSKFNPFLEWFFKSNTFKKQISGGEVTMINQITRYLLDSVSLHLPEDNEIDEVTKKISDIFSQSRELKSSYLAKLSELNAMKRSILNDAFNPVN
jgi:type I restriction enzyme S subunit